MPRTKKIRPKPLALILLEGFGVAPASEGNAFSLAKTPYFDRLVSRYPASTLLASGEAIGAPIALGSSSRVGHVVIGTGQTWQHSLNVVDEAMALPDFIDEKILEKITERLQLGARLHFVGLISAATNEASVHHLYQLLNYCSSHNLGSPFIHCILDGRDSAPTSGQRLIKELEESLVSNGVGQLATLIGRFYALDEKYNFSRLEKAFKLFSFKEGKEFESTENAFLESYDKKIFDEEFAPVYLKDQSSLINDNDIVIFFNHAGQSISALVNLFSKNLPKALLFSLTPYPGCNVEPLFSSNLSNESLGKIIAQKSWRQLRLSDSAGFPGVASWLDGAVDLNEKIDCLLVPVKASLTCVDGAIDSIKEIRRQFISAIQEAHYDAIFVNFSQLDTVAHSATIEELVSVIEKLDESLGIMMETMENAGGAAIVVGTHGLAERLIDPSVGTRNKEHSQNPVPIYIIGKNFEGFNLGWPEAVGGDLSMLTPIGSLIDVAPTWLNLAGLKAPVSMQGKNLINP